MKLSIFETLAPLCVSLALVSACDGGTDLAEPDAGAEADAGPTADAFAPPDPTEAMFDPDRVLEVDIVMAPADWDALRAQTRSFFDVLGSSCLEEPPPRPFTYFHAQVTVDGVTLYDVGVRKKGFFGSLSTTKPSIKLDFEEYVDGLEINGMDRMTLNNSISDPSYVKQCIGYAIFAAAGVPSPRCSFATVTVNGVSQGLYVNVESIKKPFIARHFADNDGNLYEGALSDFRPGWVDTFQKKTNKLDPDRSDLAALVTALDDDDSQVLADLDSKVDLDEFISLWATELLVMHADGYARNTNNYYLYHDPVSGKISFIPWGIDSILFPDAVLPWEDQKPPVTVWAEGALARRLYNLADTRARYFARLRELLDTVWDEDAILAEIDRMEEMLTPYLTEEEQTTFPDAVDAVRDFVSTRRETLETALAGTPPSWLGPLRAPWCIDTIGEVSATFSTSWGTFEADDVFAQGTGTLDVTVGEVGFTTVMVGAKSGINPDDDQPSIQVIAWLDDDTALILHMVIPDPDDVAPGELTVDWTESSGYVVRVRFPPGADPELEVVGMIGEGTITLDQAGMANGAPITGSMSTLLYEPMF